MANQTPMTNHGKLIESTYREDIPVLETHVLGRVEDNEVRPSDLVHAVRRCGWRCLAIAIPLSVTLAASTYLIQKPSYVASALLQLSSTEHNLVFEDRLERAEYEIFQATQRELVSSRYVMTAALRDKNLAGSSIIEQQSRPVEWMLDNVQVETPESTEIMTISTTTGSPQESVDVVNAVVDAYLNAIVNRNLEFRRKRLGDITDALADKQAEVRNKRNELKKLVEQLGSSDSEALSVIQQLQVQEIGSLRSQLIDVQRQRWESEARLRVLQPPTDGEPVVISKQDEEEIFAPTEDEIDAYLETDPIYAELIQDKLTAVRLNSEAKAAFKPGQQAISDSMQKLIEEELEQRRSVIRDQLTASAPRRQREQVRLTERERVLEIKKLTADLEVFDTMASRIENKIAELEQAFGQVGNQSIDVEMMQREIAQLDEVVGNIKKQSEELEVEINSRPRAEVLMRAENARVANKPQRLALAGFAGLLGFCAPITLLLILDLWSRKVNSSRSLASRTGLPILGTVPQVPAKMIRKFRRKPTRRTAYWQARLSESIKRITGRLIAQSTDDDSQILLVTSAQHKEGKTTLATQLAVSLANVGRSVLLVDFDLRKPAIHRIYHVDVSPGVCDLLRGDGDLKTAIQPTETPNLMLLPAGTCCGTALQALGDEHSVPFFRELREMADFVIIDGGPVLTSSDAGFVCVHVDQVILTARRDISRLEDVRVAAEFIRNTNAEIAGVVVVEPDQSRHVDQYQPAAIR